MTGQGHGPGGRSGQGCGGSSWHSRGGGSSAGDAAVSGNCCGQRER